MKKTTKQTNIIKKALITRFVLMQLTIIGCGSENWNPTSHLVLVDYTTSCNALDDFNIENVKKRILEIGKTLKKDDQLVVYPIHRNTQTASPIVTIQAPTLMGDLADNQRKKEWEAEILNPSIDKVVNYVFSSEQLAGTNVFAAIRKTIRTMKNGMNVKLYFISDMVHEVHELSFMKDFPKMDESDINTLASTKALEYCNQLTLKDVPVIVYLPGRPGGDPEKNNLYEKVNFFWERFFVNAGTSVRIMDVS